MGGGLMQLVAYGAQDIYLTGNRVTCTVSRNGDLMHKVYLQVTVPALAGVEIWGKNLGQALIKYAEVEIGGQRIDKHYGDWMHIWNELSQEAGKKDGYDEMTGADMAAASAETDLYIPLEFWFCRNPGLALPLIALQYHEVKINIEFRALSADLPKSRTNTLLNKSNSLVMNQYRASATRSSSISITHVRNLYGLSKEMLLLPPRTDSITLIPTQ